MFFCETDAVLFMNRYSTKSDMVYLSPSVHIAINSPYYHIAIMLTYKALHGLAPQYLSELLTVYTPRRNLRSSDSGFLIVPSTHLRSMGDQAFSSVAPKLWNSLPTEIRHALLVFLNLHLKLIFSV